MTFEQMSDIAQQKDRSFDTKKVTDLWKQIFEKIAKTVCLNAELLFTGEKNLGILHFVHYH